MTRSLRIVPPDLASLEKALVEACRDNGGRSVRIIDHCGDATVRKLIQGLPARQGREAPGPALDVVVVWETCGETLAEHLMGFIERTDILLIVPETDRAGMRQAVFPISPPKAGTHLLLKLLEVLGYKAGYSAVDHPEPGRWYYLEYLNAHTQAPDFFVDTVRRSIHGNRLHPFGKVPAIFIYRNPLDVVVSESEYYHKPGKTIFAGYLANLSPEERLLRLIDDPWLLGSIRDRMAGFAAWFDFPSVISVAYEELVGAAGGGDDAEQAGAVWSILLKLQLAGDVSEICEKIFDRNSPTFAKGRIGAHREAFTAACWEKFNALPQDFMTHFGYAGGDLLPGKRHALRNKPLVLDEDLEHETQVVVDADYLGFFIVRQSGVYKAVPIGQSFRRSPLVFEAASVDELKLKIGLKVLSD